MPILQSLVAAGIAALITPVVLRRLSASGKPDRQRGEFSVAEYTTSTRIATGAFGLLFLTIAVMAHKFPGKTDPALIPWVVAFFAGFSLLSLLSLAFMWRATAYWNKSEVQGCDLFGRRHRILWNELESISVSTIAQGYQLCASGGRTILVSEMMSGYSRFVANLKNCAPAHLEFNPSD